MCRGDKSKIEPGKKIQISSNLLMYTNVQQQTLLMPQATILIFRKKTAVLGREGPSLKSYDIIVKHNKKHTRRHLIIMMTIYNGPDGSTASQEIVTRDPMKR